MGASGRASTPPDLEVLSLDEQQPAGASDGRAPAGASQASRDAFAEMMAPRKRPAGQLQAAPASQGQTVSTKDKKRRRRSAAAGVAEQQDAVQQVAAAAAAAAGTTAAPQGDAAAPAAAGAAAAAAQPQYAYRTDKQWCAAVVTLLRRYLKADGLAARALVLKELLAHARTATVRGKARSDMQDQQHPEGETAAGTAQAAEQAQGLADFIDTVRKCCTHLARGEMGKAVRTLASAGVLELTPEVRARLEAKYPPDASPLTALVLPRATAAEEKVAELTLTELAAHVKEVHRTDKDKGGGMDGWRYADLSLLLDQMGKLKLQPELKTAAAEAEAGLMALLNDIANGRLDATLRPQLTTLRGVPLRKVEGADDVRPIAIGQLFVTVAAKLVVRGQRKRILEAVGETERGFAVSGGTESVAHSLRAVLTLAPAQVVIKTDVSNAFNSLNRQEVLDAALEVPALLPLARLLYGGNTQVIFLGRRAHKRYSIWTRRGSTQGDPLGGVLFSIALAKAVKGTLERHGADGVQIVGVADDRYIVGPPEAAFAALATYTAELAKLGLSVQAGKCAAYSPAGQEAIAGRAAAAGVPTADGITAAGAPVGTPAYEYAETKASIEAVCSRLDRLMAVWRSDAASAMRAAVQRFVGVVRHCIAPAAVMYTLRTSAPERTRVMAGFFDRQVFRAVAELLAFCGTPHADPDQPEGAATMRRMQLAAKRGGLGISSAKACAEPAYVGSLALTAHLATPLLKRAWPWRKGERAGDAQGAAGGGEQTAGLGGQHGGGAAGAAAGQQAGGAATAQAGAAATGAADGAAGPEGSGAAGTAAGAAEAAGQGDEATGAERSDTFDPEACGRLCFPLLAAACDQGRLPAKPQDEEETESGAQPSAPDIEALLEAPLRKVQPALTAQHEEAEQAAILHDADPEERAALLSQSEHGAAFLFANPGFTPLQMADREYVAAVLCRLNVPLVSAEQAAQRCPLCNSGLLVGKLCDHALRCQENGGGGLRGAHGTRHNAVKFAIVRVLQRLTRAVAGHLELVVEPHLARYYQRSLVGSAQPRPLTETDKKRGDIYARAGGLQVMFDVVVSSLLDPVACSKAAGVAAADGWRGKEVKYRALWDLQTPGGPKFVPLSLETGGRWHDASYEALKGLVKVAISGEPVKSWSGAQKQLLADTLSSLQQEVSVALVKALARVRLRLVDAVRERARVMAQAAAAAAGQG